MDEAFERRSARAGVRAPRQARPRPPCHHRPQAAAGALNEPASTLAIVKESDPWARRRSPSTARARHEFTIDDTFEAGLVLTGTEIKSIRAHKVNLADSYVRIDRREAWLFGMHIAPWETGNRYNHEAKRPRKLLLHRAEITQLLSKTKQKGQTMVPLRLYVTGRGRCKVEVALARGKQLHDRRRDIAERDSRRDVAREMADIQRGRG